MIVDIKFVHYQIFKNSLNPKRFKTQPTVQEETRIKQHE